MTTGVPTGVLKLRVTTGVSPALRVLPRVLLEVMDVLLALLALLLKDALEDPPSEHTLDEPEREPGAGGCQ